jgi:hypothetical protein
MEGSIQSAVAETAQQDATRHMGMRNLLAIASLTFTAFAAAEVATAGEPIGPVPAADAAALQCKNPQAPGYNTIICLRSPQQTEAYCARALQEPESFQSGYVGNSTSQYKVSFTEPGMVGCQPAGTRKFTFFEELRNGPSGTFQENSPVITAKTTKPYKADTVLSAPYDCATDTAGSAVRAVVKVTWIPNKKSGVTKDTVKTYDGKSQPIC